MNKTKKKIIRERLNPKIWDFAYILTRNNLRTMQKLVSLIKEKNATILDLGCGYKPFKKIIPHKKYVGIDFSKEYSSAEIICDLNIDKIKYPKSSFDIIIISDVLEHLHNTKFILKQIKKLLKKGGCVFISTPFLFCEHGVPQDYYRFTKFFYLEEFKEFKLIRMNFSNTFVSSPLLLLNILAEHLPIGFLKYIINTINNLIIIIIDYFLLKIAKILKSSYMKEGLYKIFN